MPRKRPAPGLLGDFGRVVAGQRQLVVARSGPWGNASNIALSSAKSKEFREVAVVESLQGREPLGGVRVAERTTVREEVRLR
ncbi:hypothetical protein GCM10010304_11960 [Streptomyces roseoviolaceus]